MTLGVDSTSTIPWFYMSKAALAAPFHRAPIAWSYAPPHVLEGDGLKQGALLHSCKLNACSLMELTQVWQTLHFLLQ